MLPSGWPRLLLLGLALALAIEAVTVALRFGAGLQSTRDTAWLASLTGGWRIHHGYLGGALLLAALLAYAWAGLRAAWPPPAWSAWALVAGVGLGVSDLLHHFVVLWLVTGRPHFDLRY